MKVVKELNLFLTTANPKIKLGDQSLLETKYTTPDSKPVVKVNQIETPKKTNISTSSTVRMENNLHIENISYKQSTILPTKDRIILNTPTISEPKAKQKRNGRGKAKVKPENGKYIQTQISSLNFIAVPRKRARESACPCCLLEFTELYLDKDIATHIGYCIGQRLSEDKLISHILSNGSETTVNVNTTDTPSLRSPDSEIYLPVQLSDSDVSPKCTTGFNLPISPSR